MFVHIAGSLFVCQEFLRNYFWGALERLSELNPPFILLYFPPSLSVCLQRERNNKFDTKKMPFFGRRKKGQTCFSRRRWWQESLIKTASNIGIAFHNFTGFALGPNTLIDWAALTMVSSNQFGWTRV